MELNEIKKENLFKSFKLLNSNFDLIWDMYNGASIVTKPPKTLIKFKFVTPIGKNKFILNSDLNNFMNKMDLDESLGGFRFSGFDDLQKSILEFKQHFEYNCFDFKTQIKFKNFVYSTIDSIDKDINQLSQKISYNLHTGQSLELRNSLKEFYRAKIKDSLETIKVFKGDSLSIFFEDNDFFNDLKFEIMRYISEIKLYSRLKSLLNLGSEVLKIDDNLKRKYQAFMMFLDNEQEILDNIPTSSKKQMFNLSDSNIIEFSNSETVELVNDIVSSNLIHYNEMKLKNKLKKELELSSNETINQTEELITVYNPVYDQDLFEYKMGKLINKNIREQKYNFNVASLCQDESSVIFPLQNVLLYFMCLADENNIVEIDVGDSISRFNADFIYRNEIYFQTVLDIKLRLISHEKN